MDIDTQTNTIATKVLLLINKWSETKDKASLLNMPSYENGVNCLSKLCKREYEEQNESVKGSDLKDPLHTKKLNRTSVVNVEKHLDLSRLLSNAKTGTQSSSADFNMESILKNMDNNHEKFVFLIKANEVKTKVLLSKHNSQFTSILQHEKEFIHSIIDSEMLNGYEKFNLCKKLIDNEYLRSKDRWICLLVFILTSFENLLEKIMHKEIAKEMIKSWEEFIQVKFLGNKKIESAIDQ